MATKNDMILAIKTGLTARGTGPRGGCGRAYVCLATKDKAVLKDFKAAMEACGLKYIGKAYGTGTRAAYIGYDNGSGVPLAQAEAISTNLKALGVDCYDDGVGD